jgi:hypothetical protein
LVPDFASLFAPDFAAGAGDAGRAPLVVATVFTEAWATALWSVACVEVFFAKMVLPAGAGRLASALWAAVISRGSSGVGEYTTIFCPSPSSLVADRRLMRARSPGASP